MLAVPAAAGGRFASASGPKSGAINIQLKTTVSESAIMRRMAKKQYRLRLQTADFKPVGWQA
jgi:hypothetical protein